MKKIKYLKNKKIKQYIEKKISLPENGCCFPSPTQTLPQHSKFKQVDKSNSETPNSAPCLLDNEGDKHNGKRIFIASEECSSGDFSRNILDSSTELELFFSSDFTIISFFSFFSFFSGSIFNCVFVLLVVLIVFSSFSICFFVKSRARQRDAKILKIKKIKNEKESKKWENKE